MAIFSLISIVLLFVILICQLKFNSINMFQSKNKKWMFIFPFWRTRNTRMLVWGFHIYFSYVSRYVIVLVFKPFRLDHCLTHHMSFFSQTSRCRKIHDTKSHICWINNQSWRLKFKPLLVFFPLRCSLTERVIFW